MALRLRENKNINGIKVKIDEKAHIIKISQLADDTTLFVSSKTDIALAMNEIEIFGSFSGLILNRNKTEGIWIGKLKHCKDKIRGIKWTHNHVKALGIFFGHNKEACQQLNWQKKIEDMKNQFTAWGKKSNYYGDNSYYKNTHPVETYLLSQFICSTKDVHKRN